MQKDSCVKCLFRMGIAIFISYLSVAIALPVISVYVGQKLGLPNWMGGLAVGIAFISTIFSRSYAGNFADTRSTKKCAMLGLVIYMSAAGICLASACPGLPRPAAYAILLCGRLLLGLGESMTLTGIINWHFALIGPQHSGKVLSVAGMAMYGAFAVGGPIGLTVYEDYGFILLMGLSLILPLAGGGLLANARAVLPEKKTAPRKSFLRIIHMIWQQGAVVGLQGVGFAVLGAFISLYFKSNGWPYAGFGLSCFGFGFVISRILFGALPDKIGGVRLAFYSLAVELAGQTLLWLAPDVYTALAGSLLTGLGCSMIFPAMGVEVVKRVPSELRGTAFGGFAAFQDLAYAVSAPLTGGLADRLGYPVVFMVGAIAAALGILFTISMRMESTRQEPVKEY